MHYNGAFSRNAGVSRVVLGLGKALKEKGVEIDYLYGYNAPRGMNSYLNCLNGRLHFLHHTPITALLFANFIRGKEFDVVHSHTPEAAFDAVIARALLRKKFRVLVHLHGLDRAVREEWKKEIKLGGTSYSLSTDLYLRASIFKGWFGVKLGNAFACVSRAVQREAERFYGIKPVVVPNAVDCSEFKKFSKKKARSKLGFSDNDFVVLFVGNNAWRKGLYYLVDAFKELPSNYRLVVVGLREEFKDSRITCTGQIGTTELSKYYSAADVLCVPSLNEPFGLVYLEALCFGLPCIACKGTGAEEIIEDGKSGFLVKKRSIRAISRALFELKQLGLRSKLLSFTNAKIEQFSWENSSEKLLCILRID